MNNWVKPCLFMSVFLHHLHLSPTSFWQYLLAAHGPQQVCSIFSAPKPLGRCRIVFGIKCLGISFSAGKSSLWNFQLFGFFCLSLYLFITELSVRRQNSLSGIFKLQESYKAGGSASWNFFLFFFYFITHNLMLKILT